MCVSGGFAAWIPMIVGAGMRETIEFRIPEKYAARFLPDNVGVVLGESVRKLELSPESPLFLRIGELDRQFKSDGYTSPPIHYQRVTLCRVIELQNPATS